MSWNTEMDLVTRGRLSVQRVSEEAWTAIEQLGERGGWDEASLKKRAPKAKSAGKKKSAKDREPGESSAMTEGEGANRPSPTKTQKSTKKRKRKVTGTSDEDEGEKREARPQRKSSRS